jgi:hypothetical protein
VQGQDESWQIPYTHTAPIIWNLQFILLSAINPLPGRVLMGIALHAPHMRSMNCASAGLPV